MIMQQSINNGWTAEQVMDYVGINSSTFSARMKKTNYLFQIGEIPNPSGTGRKIKLYKPEVISLWNKSISSSEIEKMANKRERADKGSNRIAEEAELRRIIYLCKEKYISMAQKNLRLSCELAILDYRRNNQTSVTADKLYRNLRKDGSKSHGGIMSVVYKENWEALRISLLRQSDKALLLDKKMNYANMLEIFENEGVAGRGFGALKIIVVDDFSRDAWSIDEDGKLHLPNGICFMDGLTGFPLWVQSCKEITTNAIATGILEVVTRYGLDEDTIFVMENSRAMKNENITQLVRSLYTKEQLRRFDNGEIRWIKELFQYQTGPIINSLPYVPTFPFKGMIERNFRLWKDEFDARRFPLNYQGGSRKEAVQLGMASMPMVIGQEYDNSAIGTYTASVDEYWNELNSWLYSDFINRARPSKFKWFARTKGIEKTEANIKNVFLYYSNLAERKGFNPNMHQVAYLLYYANPELQKRPVRINKLGGYECTIKGVTYNIMSEELNESVFGQKVVTIPIPFKKGHFVVMNVTDPSNPYFLCIAKDYNNAKSFKELSENRIEVRQMREIRNKRIAESAIIKVDNENYTDRIQVQSGDEHIAGFLDEENRIDLNSNVINAPLDYDSNELDGVDPAGSEESYILINDDTPDFIKDLYEEYGL